MNDTPLGWERFTILDGSFPRGAGSYGNTGGSSTHTHDVTITTGGPSAAGGAKAIGQTTADDSHTHSCTDTTDSASNVPPYMDVIFAQRNDPAVSTSMGSEEGQEEAEADPVSYLYTYDGDGAMVIEATGTITTVYVGGIYEYVISGTETITRSYYFAGSQRVAMRDNGELFYLLGDHLGSTSLTLDASGNRIAEQRYMPWGETRYSYGSEKTNYQFTGQRATDLGIYFYQSRFYDASLGQFLSPDTLIPSPGNVLDWNRYLYTRANPVAYTNPSGHAPWFIAGWDDSYRQIQDGNACAVVASAVALSIHRGYKVSQSDIQPAMYKNTVSLFGKKEWGIGVPPWEQALKLNAYRDIEATASKGTRTDLMNNLNNDIPTIVSIALPYDEGWGHALVVIGYDPATKRIDVL